MQLEARIQRIMDEQVISDRFKKREFVVQTKDQYPQTLLFEFTQDKTSELDKYKEGDKVQVNINIRGREWQSPQGEVKYFNSIQGWRISAMEAAGGAAEMPPMDTATADDAMGEDDLPF